MTPLVVEWRRLAVGGETGERCGSTGANVRAAVEAMAPVLAAQGMELELREVELPSEEIAHSNEVLVDGSPIEELIGGTAAVSGCQSCGDLVGAPCSCRTVKVGGVEHEELPEAMIAAAIMTAADRRSGASCCAAPEPSASSCCSPAATPASSCCSGDGAAAPAPTATLPADGTGLETVTLQIQGMDCTCNAGPPRPQAERARRGERSGDHARHRAGAHRLRPGGHERPGDHPDRRGDGDDRLARAERGAEEYLVA